MSATIFYRRLSSRCPTLDVGAPSSFGEIMSKRFGSEPWRVGPNDVSWIEGVIAAGHEDGFEDLRDKVSKHGEIEVWREH